MKPLISLLLGAALLAASVAEAKRGRGRGGHTIKVVPDADGETDIITENSAREGKVFSLFNIIQFDNAGCRSTSSISSGGTGGSYRNGTCYTSTECLEKGGSIAGSCAASFGVCCVFFVTSTGGNINQNCTYIRNPGYPNAYDGTGQVSYTIQKCDSSVCSIRLDFESFTLQGTGNTEEADTNLTPMTFGGLCLDTFQVTTATGQNIPTICGENTGQHMYIDIGNGASDTSNIQFNFGGDNDNRRWEIKVTQIPCGTQGHPIGCGCLQYHTGLTGRLSTFNFADENDNHLMNQNYGICIRQEKNMCCIRYTPCEDARSFSIDTMTTAMLPIHDSLCTGDYIGIESSMATCNVVAQGEQILNRYCSDTFSAFEAGTLTAEAPVCDCTAPFQVDIYTDDIPDTAAIAANTAHSRGVCLEYMQVPC